jgi:hypothetical protein
MLEAQLFANAVRRSDKSRDPSSRASQVETFPSPGSFTFISKNTSKILAGRGLAKLPLVTL